MLVIRRPRSCCPFHVSPLADEIFHRVAVRGPDHVLPDDRPLVEVAGGVVSGGADQLHAALVGMLIRAPAAEGGKEGVMDVDHGAVEAFQEFPRQDLHVAGQDHEVDVVLVEERELAHLLLGLVLRGDREHPIRDSELLGDALVVRMVAHDQRNLAAQLPGLVAQQQVVEAVVGPRGEDRHALDPVGVGDAPDHLHPFGQLGDGPLEGPAVGVELREVEVDALEEDTRGPVGVLIGLEDVGAVAVQQLGEGGHDAAPVRTAHEQGGAVADAHVGHGTSVGRVRRRFSLWKAARRSDKVSRQGASLAPEFRPAEPLGPAESGRPGGAVSATTLTTGTGCEVWASQGVLHAGLGGDSVHHQRTTASEVTAS
jgi:hypothetical protein